MSSLGEFLIDEIIRQPMFTMTCPAAPNEGCLAVWNGNAAEQLEAAVMDWLARHPQYKLLDQNHE